MSGSGTQLAPQVRETGLPEGRGLLAHLLHALNQPLTGLQCSLEIALAGRKQPEQYISTLREGLDLTARMRILVEAIREVADLTQDSPAQDAPKNYSRFPLDGLLRETAAELHPIAESRNIQLLTACQPGMIVMADHRLLTGLIFRFLESALSLADEGSELRVAATRDGSRAMLAVSWTNGIVPEHSPFSRAELGLLIAQAGWERAGAEWERRQTADGQTCIIRLPLASSSQSNLPSPNLENLK